MVKLYSSHCPRCNILELKLKQSGIQFEIVDDIETVVNVGRANGILSAPILETEDKFLKFEDAVKYINERK